jgi:hypothetical protein
MRKEEKKDGEGKNKDGKETEMKGMGQMTKAMGTEE